MRDTAGYSTQCAMIVPKNYNVDTRSSTMAPIVIALIGGNFTGDADNHMSVFDLDKYMNLLTPFFVESATNGMWSF